jgi:hypothetical protein
LPSKAIDEIEGEQFGADGGAFARVGHEGDVEAVKEVGGNHRKLAAGGFSAGFRRRRWWQDVAEAFGEGISAPTPAER